MSSRKVRIGIDVGGTFTDAVVVDNETYEVIAKEKCPTTHHAKQGVAEGIVRNIENVLKKNNISPEDVIFIAHGTTQATNALLEGDVAKVGIVGMGKGLEADRAKKETTAGNIELAPGKFLYTEHEFLESSSLREDLIKSAIEKLKQKGAEVIYSDIADIHVSGHACQEELKLMHSLIRPKYFMPVHGEYRHLQTHAALANTLGMAMDNIFILSNGDCLNITDGRAKIEKNIADAEGIMVDGLGVGDVGNIVLRDRRLLSESGLIILVAAIDRNSNMIASGPDIISRGFVYVRENEHLIDEACRKAEEILEDCLRKNMKDWNGMKTVVRENLRKYIYSKTQRSPVILPIFLEV